MKLKDDHAARPCDRVPIVDVQVDEDVAITWIFSVELSGSACLLYKQAF